MTIAAFVFPTSFFPLLSLYAYDICPHQSISDNCLLIGQVPMV
jgi:hypothetical protein